MPNTACASVAAPLPVARVGQGLGFQHESIVELLDGRIRRPAAKAEAKPLLQRESQDHEVLYVAVETPTFRRFDPGPQLGHRRNTLALRGALALQLVKPSSLPSLKWVSPISPIPSGTQQSVAFPRARAVPPPRAARDAPRHASTFSNTRRSAARFTSMPNLGWSG